MNLNGLLDQFLGGQFPQASEAQQNQNAQPGAQQPSGSPLSQLGLPGGLADKIPGGLAGGLAMGGIAGLLLGNKKARKTVGKLAGGAVGVGGAAILGALAFNAYKNWQGGSTPAPASPAPTPATRQPQPQLLEEPSEEAFAIDRAPANDGGSFELSVVKAMIAAANADGHIDSAEQKAIFEAVEKIELKPEEKSFIFDTLANPPSVHEVAGYANGLAQASELYLASRLAIDPDHPAEQQYLADLAGALGIPDDFIAHLERQIEANA